MKIKLINNRPGSPADFGIGCVVGAMLYLNINFFIMLGVLLALNFIIAKMQGVQYAESDGKRGIIPIKPMLIFMAGMIGTEMALGMFLGVTAVQ